MKAGRSINDLALELQRRDEAKRDFRTPPPLFIYAQKGS